MSTNNKKAPRKSKLVPRLYVENEDETTDQLGSIKITDIKMMANEFFDTPQRPNSTKTYPNKATISKPKVAQTSTTETVMYKISQSHMKVISVISKLKPPSTLVSKLSSPATIVSEFETPSTSIPQTKAAPTIVSEINTPKTILTQPEVIQRTLVPKLNIPILPEPVSTVVSELTTPATIVSQINTSPTVVSQLGTPQISNMFSMSVDVEVEEFDDEDRLQIDESAFEDEEIIKMEMEKIEKLEREMQIGLKKCSNRLSFQNILVKQEKVSPERETAIVYSDRDMIIDLQANITVKTENEDITHQIAANVNSNKKNKKSKHKQNKLKQKILKIQQKNMKSKQKVGKSSKNNVKSNRNRGNSNDLNVNNVNCNQNNVNSNTNHGNSKDLNVSNVNSNKNNVNSNTNNMNTYQITHPNNITELLTAQTSHEPNPITQYSVSESQILSTSENILKTSKNIADKILAIEARNIIGHIAKEKESEINTIDTKIQYALDDWKNWTAGSRRPPPLLYKCYICLKSWWYLSEFQDHLRGHTEWNLKVSVEETSVEECNIIAYTELATEVLDIETDGSCWRCGYDYSIHKVADRKFESFYSCKNCEKQFSSCTSLREHEFSHGPCRNMVGNFKCFLCPLVSPAPGERRLHMLQKHSVRTDVPISTPYKRCNDCGSKYFIYNMHYCRNKIFSNQCNYCFRKFNHRLLAELHMTIGNTSTKCRVCSLVLPKKCMELEHVLMHTTMFIFAYKCITCDEFNVYLDEVVSMQHRYIKHKQKYDQKKNYFDKVLVPISCILPTYTSPENELQPITNNVNVLPNMDLPLIPEIKLEVMDEEIIGVNDEPEQLIIKEENPSDEEYEDDIIRLNYDHSDADINRRKPKIYNCRRCPFKGRHKIYKEHLLTKCGRLKSVMRRPKVYSCMHCNFQGHHSVYKEHLKSDCSKQHSFLNEDVYTCTKCDTDFDSIKRYLAHFSLHGYKYQQCPVCLVCYQNFSTLIIHFNSHIRQSYIKMYSIQCDYDASQKSNQFSVCKMCSEEVSFDGRFVHWEGHLNLDISYSTAMVPNEAMIEDENDDNDEELRIEEKNNVGLKSHMLETLLDNLQCDKMKIRECPQCLRNFSRNNDCKRHFIEHLISDAYSKWRKYYALQCQICGQHFKKADKYKRHMRDHGCLPIFQCEVCDKAFSDSSNFTKHKKVHNMRVLICDICNKKFQAKISLIKHMEIHKSSKPITCSICVKDFPTESLYRRHVRTKHQSSLKKNYGCIICKEKFYTCKEKWEHAWEMHKERTHKADCSVCGMSFRTIQALKRHDRSNVCGLVLNKNESGTLQLDNNVLMYVKQSDDTTK